MAAPPTLHLEAVGKISTTMVTFSVRGTTTMGEHLFLVGSDDAAGHWDVKKGLLMETSPEVYPVWKVSVELPTSKPFEYRYLVREEAKGNSGGKKFSGVKRWEFLAENRKVTPLGLAMDVVDQEFGKGSGPEEVHFDEGWLFEESEFRLKIGARNPHPVELFEPQPFRLKVFVVPVCGQTEEPTFMTLKVFKHSKGEDGVIKTEISTQLPFHGWKWQKGDIGMFSCRSHNGFVNSSVVVELITDDDRNPTVIGSSVILVRNLLGSSGAFTVPIVANNYKAVGTFFIEYLLIHPFEHPNSKLFNAKKYIYSALHIGHRGSGQSNNHDDPSSFKSLYKENTIPSFIQAAKKGVNFVEFDVLLTRDRIPIVYHDFQTRVSLERLGSRMTDPYDLDINKLSLKELQSLKLDFATSRRKKMFSKLLRERLPDILALKEDTQTLDVYVAKAKSKIWERITGLKERIPTLVEVFKSVPESVGFNVEIKYPVPLKHEPDQDQWEDMNSYVDAILRVIFENAGSRKIVISCFDPDICSVVKLKQPCFPVFFLTTAGHERYGENKDARTNSVQDAVLFSKTEKFLGIVCYSTPLLEQPSLIRFVKENGILLFTWGEANNVLENKLLQHKLGVDAVISDNADHTSSTN